MPLSDPKLATPIPLELMGDLTSVLAILLITKSIMIYQNKKKIDRLIRESILSS